MQTPGRDAAWITNNPLKARSRPDRLSDTEHGAGGDKETWWAGMSERHARKLFFFFSV